MMRLRLFLIIPGVVFLVALFAFEFGLRKGRETAAPAGKAPGELSARSDADLIALLLAQDLGERRFPFSNVVEAASGRELLPIKKEEEVAKALVSMIRSAADQSLMLMNEPDSPVRGLPRINEASRHFEELLQAIIDADPAFSCTIPVTSEGKEQRSGYPDLRVEHLESGTLAYLDPKLFESGSRDSSFRTFYFEPRKRSGKIRDDAHHLLLGIAHDGNDGQWHFSGWELIDLARLEVRLKAEFQASNRDLYTDSARVAVGKTGP